VFILNNLGEVLLEFNRDKKALQLFKDALNLAENKLLGDDCLMIIKNNILKLKVEQ
jgi:ribosomal protein L16/L10AE